MWQLHISGHTVSDSAMDNMYNNNVMNDGQVHSKNVNSLLFVFQANSHIVFILRVMSRDII